MTLPLHSAANCLMNLSDETLEEKFARRSSHIMMIVIVFAFAVLFGWQFDIEMLRRPFPRGGTMNPVSSICFILCGISFLVTRRQHKSPIQNYLGYGIASIISLVGLLKLASTAGLITLTIDGLIFTDKLQPASERASPLMAANTAVNFSLLGIALILNIQNRPLLRRLSNFIASAIVLIALLSLLRYVYNAQDTPGIVFYIRMSLVTAIGFSLVGLALLFSNTHVGFMSILSSRYSGGVIARILLPAALFVPVIIGFLRLLIDRLVNISDEMGVVFLITGIVLLFAVLIFFVSAIINRADIRRRHAEEQLAAINRDLEQKVADRTADVAASERRIRAILENSPDAIVITDENLLAKYQTPAVERMTGLSLEHRRAHPDERYTHPDDAPILAEKMKQLLEHPETPLPFQIRMRTTRGNYIWIDGIMANLLADNNVKGISFSYRDVTDRKKLEEQQALMGLIVDSSDDAIIMKSLDGIIMSWNRGAGNMFGYEVGEVLGKNINLIIPEKIQEDETHILESVKRGKSVEHLETKRRHKDGRQIEISASFAPVRDDAGKIIGVSTIARDITEQKAYEQKLILERTLLRTLIDNIPDYIYVKDPLSRHIINNQAMVNLLGAKTEEETLGKSSIDFLGKEVAAPYLEEDREILSSGNAKINFEETTITPTGEIKYLLTTKVPLRDASGQTIGLVGISHDITAQKKVEVDLKTSKHFLELAQAAGHTGHWVLDLAGGQRMTWSLEATRILNIADPGLDDKLDQMYEYVHPEDVDELRKVVNTAARDRSPFSLNHRIVRKDGTLRWVHQQAAASLEADTPLLIGIVQDITERKNSEDEILKLNAELEQRVALRTEHLQTSNKEMEAFTYSVSHDLRAPLRIIHGFSKILSEDYQDKFDAAGQKTLDAIMRNVKKMGQLIDDLLDFSRLGRAEIRASRIDMNLLVSEVIEDLRIGGTQIPENLTIDKLELVHADVSLIKQVWVNLISNAIKYSAGKADPAVHIGMKSEKGHWAYFVKDNGAGFDMTYYHKLFGVFQRLHRADEFQGTGVGLAIVHRVITRHGGIVWAESIPDEGATFYFTLPEMG